MKGKSNFIEVTPIYGEKFKVDISDKACEEFGFKHNDRIKCNNSQECCGTVMGVAGDNLGKGKKVLWIALDDDKGKVCYSGTLDISKII